MSQDKDKGYGQLEPVDSTSELGRIAFAVRGMLARLRTMTPVRVEAVHADGGLATAGTVDVKPLVSMLDGNRTATEHGTVMGLPYFRLQGGKNALIFDPEKGDVGFVVVSDRDVSAVKQKKGPAPPGSLRRFDLADGVYVGGILNAVPEQYVLFSPDGVKVADKNGNVLEMASGKIRLTAVEVEVAGNLKVTGTTALQGALAAAGVSLTGALTGTSATFSGGISATTGTFSGALAAASGALTGTLTANTVTSAGNVTAGLVLSGIDLLISGHLAYTLHTHSYLVPSSSTGAGPTGTPS